MMRPSRAWETQHKNPCPYCTGRVVRKLCILACRDPECDDSDRIEIWQCVICKEIVDV